MQFSNSIQIFFVFYFYSQLFIFQKFFKIYVRPYHRIRINIEAKVVVSDCGTWSNTAQGISVSCDNPLPPLLFRGFEQGAFSLEVYKLEMKEFKNYYSSFEPAFFRGDVH